MPQSEDEPTYYEVLGIQPTFPPEAIDGVRKSLSKLYHPSGSKPDEARMAEINNACDVLGDVERREEYDAELKAEGRFNRPHKSAGERARRADSRQNPPKTPPPSQPPPFSATQRSPQSSASSTAQKRPRGDTHNQPQATQAGFPSGYKGKLIFRGIFSLVWWFIFADGFGGLTYLNDPWAYIPAGVAVVMLIARK